MSHNKEELGKGIRSLLQDIDSDLNTGNSELESSALANSVSRLPLDQIEINPFQPRTEFDEQSLWELAESIRVHGVIQPVSVRKISNGKFQLIVGERRLKACKMVGLTDIPTYVRSANDQEMLEMALIENTHREDLNALEIAINYKRLMEECDLKQEELGTRVGKDRASISNYLRLLRLPPEIQVGLRSRSISMGHARALVAIEDSKRQIEVYNEIIKKGISVRMAEFMAKNSGGKRPAPTAVKLPQPEYYNRLQSELEQALDAKVKLRKMSAGGEITIKYRSEDQLNRLVNRLNTK